MCMIVAVRDIAAGEPFTAENTALLRSEKNLLPGLDPGRFELVLGRKAARAVPSGKGVEPEDVEACGRLC